MTLLYEGKAKKYIPRINPMSYVLNTKMKSLQAMVLKDAMSGKGKLNNRITSIIFEYLEKMV